jgi:hypothetical protein
MGSDTESSGIISKERLDQLVSLFDRSEYALEPDSRDAQEAEAEFKSLIDSLYQEVSHQGFKLAPAQFKALVRRHCQAVVVRGLKKTTTLPPSA